MSIKTDLIGEQFVKGNIKDFLQTYHIYYYPPEQNFPTSKVWIYLDGKLNGKPRTIRSLCFEKPEGLKTFISNLMNYYLYWLEKKSIEFKPQTITIGEYRRKLLEGLLIDLKNKTQANGIKSVRESA